MTFFVSRISVSQATTVINAITTFIQYSISLSLIIILVRFMPKTNIALAWSTVARMLNSTIWPTLLRVDAKPSGVAVVTISWLILLVTVLVTIASIALPLGLREGSLQRGQPHNTRLTYLRDTSGLALATTPHRDQFVYGRMCGSRYMGKLVLCPAASGNSNPDLGQPLETEEYALEIAPPLVEIFNSTPHGPFSMQPRFFSKFRQDKNTSVGTFATTQSFIQQDGIILAEGVVIDMSSETPGVGLLNHTVPEGLSNGGVWSRDVLWLEPVTSCVNTNLTVDYLIEGLPGDRIDRFNLTDHGGFFGLVSDSSSIPSLDSPASAQADIDLTERAFKAAFFSNYFASRNLSISPESFHLGQSYPLTNETGGFLGLGAVGHILFVPLDYTDLSRSRQLLLEKVCSGYSFTEDTSLAKVDIKCGVFLSPPVRVDGGDPQSPQIGSRWTQELVACASSTRASIQQLEFSTNDTHNLNNIQVTRQRNLTVLWGMEKSDMPMGYFDPFWGRVEDRFENDTRIWAVRSDGFYPPAGESSFMNLNLPVIGVFLGAPAGIWGSVYSNYTFLEQGYADYSAQSNFPLRTKFRSLVEKDPVRGHAQIRNLIWTDIMANSVVGTQAASVLPVVPHLKSLEYDFRFATPGFLLLLIWIPAFITVASLFLSGILKLEYVRLVLNHTSVGRVVVGSSGLQVNPESSENASDGIVGKLLQRELVGRRVDKDVDWVVAGGQQRVVLDMARDRDIRFSD